VSLTDIDSIIAAAERIAGHVLRTPTVPSPGLAAHLGVPATCKLELLQRTGSFKPRGAVHKMLSLSSAERDAGVVAVSGGQPWDRGRRRGRVARCRCDRRDA
jgi:threonine dehydratase